MKRLVSVFLVVLMLLTAAPLSGLADINWSGLFDMKAEAISSKSSTTFTFEHGSSKVTFDDSWLKQSSYTYNHDLAKFCSLTSLLSYNSDKFESGMKDLGFSRVFKNWPKGTSVLDQNNLIIFERSASFDSKKIVMIVLGGTNGDEWYSNFEPGEGATHKYFEKAANYAFEKFINQNYEYSKCKIIVVGHSRGGSVSNLLAKKLDDASYIRNEDVFAYTFASSMLSSNKTEYSQIKYRNIYNFVNPEDFVTRVMPWENYGRYGITFSLPSKTTTNDYSTFFKNANSLFKKYANTAYVPYKDGTKAVDSVISKLTSTIPSVKEFYHKEMQVEKNNTWNPRWFFKKAMCPLVAEEVGNSAFVDGAKAAINILKNPYACKTYKSVLSFFMDNQGLYAINQAGIKLMGGNAKQKAAGVALAAGIVALGYTDKQLSNSKPYFAHAHMCETYAAFVNSMSESQIISRSDLGSSYNGKTSYTTEQVTSEPTPTVSQPVISFSSVNGGYNVTIKTNTSGATIYYTTNGSTPTKSSTKYTGAFKITGTKTIKAKAFKSGYNDSPVVSQTKSIGTVATPIITASYSGKKILVKMTCSTSGSTIYYTLDGKEPTNSSKKYTGQISLTANSTIKAIAYKSGMKPSEVQTKKTNATKPAAPSPRIINGNTVVGTNAILNLEWNSVSYADNYIVSVYNAETDSIVNGATFNIERNCISLDVTNQGIAPGKYYFIVNAENFIGKSNNSSKVNFEIKPDVSVKFVADESVVSDTTMPYGSTIFAPKDPEKTGHDFKGWIGFSDGMKATENKVFTARFEKKTFSVNFVYADKTKKYEDDHIQQVRYGEQAVIPSDVYLTNSSYKVTGWYVEYNDKNYIGDFSVDFVDENMTVKPILDLNDPTLPLTVDDASFKVELNTGNHDYTFSIMLENGTNEAQTGATIVAVLKTAADKVVATTTQDIGTIPAKGSKNYSLIINSTKNASKAEVYVVEFSDDVTGKAFSAVKTAIVSSADNKVYGEWSAWSTARPSAEDGRIIETVVQKAERTKQTTTSTSSSMTGWTSNGSTTTYGGWSNVGWTKTKPTESDVLRIADTKTITDYTNYNLYYWRYYNSSYGKYMYTYGSGMGGKKYTKTVKSTDATYYKTYEGKYKGYTIKKSLRNYSDELWFLSSTKDVTHTEWYYQTREKTITYSYYKWTDYSPWENTSISPNNLPANTDTTKYQIAYRYKDLEESGNTSISAGEDNSGKKIFTVVNKLPTDTDYSGKKATLVVFKTKIRDGLAKQIVAIKQITIGAGNTYSYDFIPKEELSENTGDFKVQICVAGVETSFISEVIETPKKEYTVSFEYNTPEGIQKTETQVVKEGEDAIAPVIPELEGYVFIRWNKNITNIHNDLSVRAEYSKKQFTVVFVDWVNSSIISIDQKEYEDVLKYPEAKISAKGKIFKGWTYPEGYVITESLVVETDYDNVTYTVNFVDEYGDIISSQIVPYGGTAKPPKGPEKEGYTFSGWSTAKNWWKVTKDIDVSPIYALKNTGVQVSLLQTDFAYTGKDQKPEVFIEDSNGIPLDYDDYELEYSDEEAIDIGSYSVTVRLKGNYVGSQTINYNIVADEETGLPKVTKLKQTKVTATMMKLSWSKATGAKYYEVYGSTNGKTFKKITTVSATSAKITKVNGKALAAGKTYYFKVRALDATGECVGAFSKVLKTGTLTAAPQIKQLSSTSSKSATVTWGKVTGAKSYAVYKSTDGKKWTKVGTTTSTSFSLTELAGGKKIYVKVLAVNAYKANSAYSAVKSVTVKK